jgi:methylmalonyl-CoA mutase C-terminal domain/subunit
VGVQPKSCEHDEADARGGEDEALIRRSRREVVPHFTPDDAGHQESLLDSPGASIKLRLSIALPREGSPTPARRRPERDLLVMARKTRVLIAKVGLDGHDVGARVVARGLLEAGMEVIYTGIRRTPEQVVRAAIDEDVDVIGVSILSGAHETLLPRIRSLLDEADGGHIMLIAGGVIPQEDIPVLEERGVARIFLSGTPISEIVDYIGSLTRSRSEARA